MSDCKGYFVYEGYAAMQHDDVLPVFRDFIQETRPRRILEIGTAQAGFTLALRNLLNEAGLRESAVRSFDITRLPWFDAIASRKIELIVENIFDDHYSRFTKPELIVPFIQAEGTTLVLCDGGYKVGEFNLIAPLLKAGDYIMAHDYIDTEQNFRENYLDKIWNWQEIQERDIRETCAKYGLVDFHREAFSRVVWVCKKKAA
jgi:cephalosporin hydroxylase